MAYLDAEHRRQRGQDYPGNQGTFPDAAHLPATPNAVNSPNLARDPIYNT